jgi:tRNA pseudouridine55 synthase
MGRRGGPGQGPDGLVVVDKPTGWTSHDVVAKSRGMLGTRKVGHAGTLDPDAIGEVRLGVDTSTLDSSGEVTATYDLAAVTIEDVARAAAGFVGDIEQIPPMVSAVKIDGKRLHELARAGKEVDRAPRPVTIHALEVAPVGAEVAGLERIGGSETDEFAAAAAGGSGISFQLDVTCSSGTYIRTLAEDLGRALGGGGHLVRLRRIAVGPYTVDDAVPLDQVAPERTLPMGDAVRHLPRVDVDEVVAADIAVGKVLERASIGIAPDADDEHWAVFDPSGQLLAVYEPFRASTVKPSLVIPG